MIKLLLVYNPLTEVVFRRCSVKKVFLKISSKFTGKHLCQSLFFEVCNFIKKETLAQVFFCEFYGSFKNIFFYKTPLVAASTFSLFSFLKHISNDRIKNECNAASKCLD